MIRQAALILVAACLLLSTRALALPPEILEQAQRATALVDVPTAEGHAYGSAFCVNDKKTFITAAHVILHRNGGIKLVIRPGEKDEKVLGCHTWGIDYTYDLAVLRADKNADVTPFNLGNSDNLMPTQEVTAFGYPFGNRLALDKDAFPNVTVNTGKITALRKEKGDLRLIQIDALVNPGDSGGPVLGGDGQVIGIVESGVSGAGVNFATPVTPLKKMLQEPMIVVDPFRIDYAKRNKQQTFTVYIHSFSKDIPAFDVELAVADPKGHNQTVSGKAAGGKCDLSIVPTTDETAMKWNPFAEPAPNFKFTLTLKLADKITTSHAGTIYIENVPPSPELTKVKEAPKNGNALDPLPANAVETAIIGPEKADPMRSMLGKGQFPAGIKYTTALWEGKTVIAAIQLFHQKPAGDKWQLVTAKEGYVVGGLIVDTGEFLNGFKVIFIRKSKAGKLDPSDTYTSDWVGRSTNGKTEQLAGRGERILGLCGRKGTFVRAIGLVIEKQGDAPATQPAKN